MKKSVGIPVLALAGLGLLANQTAGQTKAPAAPVVWPAADIQWVDNPAIAGAKVAVLWGHPKVGRYGALKKLPAGGAMPLHTHTHDQHVVVLSGSIVLALEGSAPKELGPGSYAFIPGGHKHTADCKAGADCVYLEEQPGLSDIKFAAKK